MKTIVLIPKKRTRTRVRVANANSKDDNTKNDNWEQIGAATPVVRKQ